MTAVPLADGPLDRALTPVTTLAVTGVLTVLALLVLWLVPPSASVQWLVIWEIFVGAGFAAAGCAAVAAASSAEPEPEPDPAAAGGGRALVPGRWFVLVALLFLAAPPVRAAGHPTASAALAVVTVTIVVPLALLRVVARRPVAVRLLEGVLVACGAVAVLARSLDAPVVAWSAALGSGIALFCAGWVQFELTAGDERRQVLWVIVGVCSSVPVGALFVVAADGLPLAAAAVGLVLSVISLVLPLTAGIAVVAPRRFDVRDVIRRSVVLAVMVTAAVAVFAAAESFIELAFGTPPGIGVQGFLAAAVAAGFHPVLLLVRASMDELLFGGRADPVDTLTRLGSELESGSSPQEWLDALRGALAVPGVVLRRDGAVIAGSGGIDGAETSVTVLRTGAQHVGELVVALPPDQLRLPPTTQAVLGLVAPPLAQALHAVRLTEQLQLSRGQVVAVLEEERRRVRRDLHDSLGPTLTGIAYSADAAVNLVRGHTGDTDAAVLLLRQLRADAGEAIAEVRRIVYGLRPKALDELGLVGAVRQRVSHLRSADGASLTVDVVAPDDLPDLPAAVEVAAYRVAVEGVTNVARHAGVATATVELVVDGGNLRVAVHDAGVSPHPWPVGVGMRTMRERVEQIGGILDAAGGPDGGHVVASIPLITPA